MYADRWFDRVRRAKVAGMSVTGSAGGDCFVCCHRGAVLYAEKRAEVLSRRASRAMHSSARRAGSSASMAARVGELSTSRSDENAIRLFVSGV